MAQQMDCRHAERRQAMSTEREPKYLRTIRVSRLIHESGHTDILSALEELKQLKAASRLAVPDGYVLAPKEPTDDMLVSGQEAWIYSRANCPAREDCEEAYAVYTAMIAAAPQEDKPI
jgi:hypothetical protein